MAAKKNAEKTPDEKINEMVDEETDNTQPESQPEDPCNTPEYLELKDRYLRLMAEYDNFRKRTAKERDGLYLTAKSSVVEQFLPVFDNLERAVNQPTEDEAYKKGVDMIMQQFMNCLERLGVNEVEALGAPFDPEKHNAVMHSEDDTLQENIVAEVFQKGFEADGKVIRHAVVRVVN